MPARVHAFLVVRPSGRGPTDLHLSRTLRALAAQTRLVDVLTVVLCGPDDRLKNLASESGAEAVIVAPRGTGFADALRLATHRLAGDAVWLLAQDTAPAPDALSRLTGALETAPSVAIAAPKLVSWEDPARIVSLGVTMTRGGRAVGIVDGELDQGQHDVREDVLGSDVRGALVRTPVWLALKGLDPALAGADEGLDLGVRARLAGGRVALAPGALVAVAGDGVAGAPTGGSATARGRRIYAERTAQLHRRLAYAPPPAVLLHWLSFLPLALLRSLGHLVAKRPGRIGPEWAAAITAMARIPSVARARRTIRRVRQASWQQLAPLRIGRREIRERLDDDAGPPAGSREELRFFSGGGAWVVLGALATSVMAFVALLSWPVLGGGALAPLRSGVVALWTDAAYGPRALGWDTVGPADPFAAVVALIGSLSPAEPSRALVVLWVLALPLAALGGWFAATRVTDRSILRALAAFAWATAPTFLTGLIDGRPAAVIAHLALPWFLYTMAAARRSWSSAGVASLLLAIVVACSPSAAGPVLVLWAVGLVLTVVMRRGQGAGRVAWVIVPTVAMFAPLVWRQIEDGNALGLLADPGRALFAPAFGESLSDRLLMIGGFPSAEAAGWAEVLAFLGADVLPAWAAIVFVAPLILLAVLAPLVGRIVPAALGLLTAVLGIGTAVAVSGVAIAVGVAGAAPIWPGVALSLAWAGLLTAAISCLDGFRRSDAAAPTTVSLIAAVSLAFLAVGAAPALTAPVRGEAALRDGPASTLPAYVKTAGSEGEREGQQTATLVLTPDADAGFAASVVWGASETLGGQTTLQSTRAELSAGDRELARVAADLVSSPSGDVVAALAEHGVAYVLLSEEDDETDAARALRLSVENVLNQRDDLVAVGETARGALWSVAGEVVERTADETAGPLTARIALLQVGVVAIALLLAVPTRTSLRDARRHSRVIGVRRAT